MGNASSISVPLALYKKREIAIGILHSIGELDELFCYTGQKLNRLMRELFLVILLDRWLLTKKYELIDAFRLASFSCYTGDKHISFAKYIRIVRRKVATKFSMELDQLVDSNTKSDEFSLCLVTSINEICMDVCFRRRSNNSIFVDFSSERRKQGIHYTPWDLSISMAKLLKNSSAKKTRILDPAMGCGSFLLASKFLFGNKKIEYFGGDKDPIAVFASRVQFRILEPECISDEKICRNFVKMDFLTSKGQKFWSKFNIDAIIMNPPYVSVSQNNKITAKFKLKKTRNLSSYFLERCYSILDENCQIVAVIPINIATAGSSFNLARELILEKSSKVSMKHIDTVPGYLFDQGKFESGDGSNSVSTRVTIFDIETGLGSPEFFSTRFIRWETEDRKKMLEIKPEKINPNHIKHFDNQVFPMGGKCDLELLNHIHSSSNKSLKEIISNEGKYMLQILKPVRYYVAVGIDVHQRNNTINLCFENYRDRNAAFALLVSGTFFWWWRLYGNGQQLRKPEVDNFPWPNNDVIEKLSKKGEQLIGLGDEEHIRVTSSNKGQYHSLAYRHGMDVIFECDQIISQAFFPSNFEYQDFLSSCRFPNVEYFDKPEFEMKNKMKHTTPSKDRNAVLEIIMSELKKISSKKDEHERYLSMKEMYEIIETHHDDQDLEFTLTPIQLAKHKQRSGPIENNFKHDLKNSLSNMKSKGKLINPKRDQWGWPKTVTWYSEIQDKVRWNQFKENASRFQLKNSRFKLLNISADEIQIESKGKKPSIYSINSKLVEERVQHLLNCGAIMDSQSFHSWVAPRDAIIEFHPNLEYTRGSKRKRVRYMK